jgi:uncharacterized membrane protein (UPF0127 family)
MLYTWKKWQILETSSLKFRGRNMNFIPFISPAEQAKGLMHRKEPLGPNAAGLFIYDKPEMRSFWMKNTYIPLDIVFLDENGEIVGIHLNAKPESEESIESPAPAQYVIELDAGQASALALRVGDQFFL